jgi:hypothetical protein
VKLDNLYPLGNLYQIGSFAGSGLLRDDGYGQWTMSGTWNGTPITWTCGATFFVSSTSGYVRGGCDGNCLHWGTDPARCSGQFQLDKWFR